MIPQAAPTWTLNEAAHLLSRAGFGGKPAEIRELHALGRKGAVESLLGAKDEPEKFPVPEWASPEQALAGMQTRREMAREARQATLGMSPEEAEAKKREIFRKEQMENQQQMREAQDWWFGRMLGSKAPLREKMTLFWHDHFATSIQKVREPVLMLRQNELFRNQALGNFRTLTNAMLTDAAMLRYLDAQNSRKGMPNENFAREIMELFTLGEGHYSEQDIREAARAFTGYQFDPMSGNIRHNRRQWDDSAKTIFGKSGKFNGEDVIALIFDQTQPAKFMAAKIWEFFAYENPPSKAIDALAETLRNANYELVPLLREIFLSKEFYSEASMRSQIKCPLQFIVQLHKQLEIDATPKGFAFIAQQQLGQTLFMPPNVAGWDWGKAWINTNTLLTRYNLAGFLSKGAEGAELMMKPLGDGPGRMGRMRKPDAGWAGPDYEKIAPRTIRSNPQELVDYLTFRFFNGPIPEKAKASFVEYAITKQGAILTNKETAELCHLMLSTPYYQLC